MRAWLPERQVYGPEPAGERDTDALNRVFADALTDRHRGAGLAGPRGFAPGHLTVTLTHDIATRGPAGPALLSQRQGDAGAAALTAARHLVDTLAPGYDFTREIVLTAELGLGDTSLVDGDDGLAAFVLWHSTPLAEGRPKDEVRVLKLAARDDRAFDASIATTEAAAARAGIRRVAVRCQTRFDDT